METFEEKKAKYEEVLKLVAERNINMAQACR